MSWRDADAEAIVRSSAAGVVDRFLRGMLHGSWHPNGFAVFSIGEVANVGRLRLHVWARHQRIALEGQPAIHSHPWTLCSLVLAGCYVDTLYTAEEFSSAGEGRLQGYRIRFGAPGEGDEAYPVPHWYKLSVVEERKVTAGQCHHLSAGALHATNVPDSSFAMTLVLTSISVELDKLLLIGDADFGVARYVRPLVSADHLSGMQSAALALLGAAETIGPSWAGPEERRE